MERRWLVAGALGALIAVCTIGPRPHGETASREVRAGPPIRESTVQWPSAGLPLRRSLDPVVDRRLTVWLPVDPTTIASADCFSTIYDPFSHQEPLPKAALPRAATWVAQNGFAVAMLPRWARASIEGAGLAPEDLTWLGHASPWLDYALLGLEQGWALGDGIDVLRDEASQRGVSWMDVLGDNDQELVERMQRAVRPRLEALSAHALALSESEVPGVRSGAVATGTALLVPGAHTIPLDRLLDSGLTETSRNALLTGHCREVAGFDASGRAALATLAHDATDAEFAVRAAMVGLRDAEDAGEDTVPWLDLLDEAHTTCERWGRRADLARHPALQSFDGLPEVARPEGFPAAVDGFAAAAGLSVDTLDCSRPPCTARLTQHDGGRWPQEQASAVWGNGFGFSGFGRGDTTYLTLVALPEDLPRKLRGQIAGARSGLHRDCLGEDSLGAVRVEYGAAPRTWEEALQAALFACHRDPYVGPLAAPWSGEARWDGTWTFDPPLELLDCVADRVEGPTPNGPTTLGLGLGLR
ncbi:MAG: hypothetical protein R3F59_10895 [Myxococcota bacterium]